MLYNPYIPYTYTHHIDTDNSIVIARGEGKGVGRYGQGGEKR